MVKRINLRYFALSMNLFQDLQKRGLIYQATDPQLEKALQEEKLTFYVGFDPTADSLHIGNLLQLITMRRLQDQGHRPIALAGGATGRIGDPSGKSEERQLLDSDRLQRNLEGISRDFAKVLDMNGKNAATILDNSSWFQGISYIDFLRDVGKHFTVNHMMGKESIRSRFEDREQGISYTEFSYMLLQAYDFYHLYQKHSCRLQLGGSDQWGNITAGCELIRRKNSKNAERPAFGLTLPLIQKADGSKFGKTVDGAVWMDAQRTSPYAFYQYFIQASDQDVIPWLRYFTFLSDEEIHALEQAVQSAPHLREAQQKLASEVTRFIHGEKELQKAQTASKALFGTEIKTLDESLLLDVFAGAPTTELPRSDLASGLSIVDLLTQTTLCQSKGAARRDLSAGGIYLNNDRVDDPEARLTAPQLIAGAYAVLRKGKKNYQLIRFR